MTREEAIKILKSKLDGHTDTSWEWTEAVRMAVNALEKTWWIPVSEKLPEEYVPVLVSTKFSVFPEARYSKKYGWEWAYADGEWLWLNNIVTAWMPLPEPYKEIKEESE